MEHLIPLFRDKASPHISIIKILVFLIFVFSLRTSIAEVNQKLTYSSQEYISARSISIDVKNESLSAVLNKIEAISRFSFVYSNEDIDITRTVNFQVKNENLENTLKKLLEPLNINHQIIKSKIILKTNKPGAQLRKKKLEEATISGKVTDDKNEPLPGVTVVVKGTSTGTATDADGNYSIVVQDPAVATLVFSFIGYTNEEVLINNQTTIYVQLTLSLEALNEVVVVGYATQKKVNLTGAVSTVNAEALESRPVNNVTQALQGTSPNLIIQQQSSEPGSQLNINVRGIGTLGDNSPLIVIDGIPSNTGAFSSINPNDIESISVLKDAASAAIYGSRSANGVILVTTKQGKLKSKPTVSYNGIIGWQTPTFLQKPVNAYEFAMLKNEALVNSGQTPQFSPDDLRRIYDQPENEWFLDGIFKKYAPQQSHNLSVSGGTDNTTYLISVGRMDQSSNFEGPNFGYRRTNARANITANISSKLKTGLMLAYTNNKIKEHAYTTEFIVADASRIPRLYPLKDSLGNYNIPPTSSSNPLARLEKGGERIHDNDNLYGNVFAEYYVINNLRLKAVFGANLWNYNKHEFRKSINYLPFVGGDGQNQIEDENNRTLQTNVQFIGDYNISINRHSIGLLAGYSSEDYSENASKVRKINVDNEFAFPTSATEVVLGETYNQRGTPWAINSVFGRVTYNFSEKYLFEANFRYDGSSRFAKGNRWGFFPSLSGGWRITEEQFLGFLKDNVGNIKIRGSWGQLGNQSITPFQYTSNIDNRSNSYGFNNQGVTGAFFSSSNPDITWETSTMWNVGADVDILKGKLSFSFDYFNKRTEDILMHLSVPLTYGADAPVVNAAVVDNKGWEAAITYHHSGEHLNHKISANLADNLNTVVDIKGKEIINGGGDRAVMIREGFPINSYYAYKTDGYFQNLEEIEAGPKPGFVANGAVSPGDIRYVDKNGDGTIDQEDRFMLGNPFPRYTFGFNYSVEWQGFDLNLFVQGVGKRNLYLRGESVEAFHNNWDNVYQQHLDRWTPTNPDADYPRLTIGTASTNNNAGSDFWLQNAAYARLKNVQLGYTIPNTFTRKIGVNRVRLYVTGHNLVTITKMKTGFDPEISEYNNSLSNRAEDVSGKVNSGRVYPNLKVYAMGLDISF